MENEKQEIISVHMMSKKLSRAEEKYDALNAEFEGQIALYDELVNKLVQTYKGLHLELDNKFSKYRQPLANRPDLVSLKPMVDDILKTIKSVDTKIKRQTTELQTGLLTYSERLQKSKGLPNQVRRDLRELISEIQSSQGSIFSYIPLFEGLSELYQLTITSKEELAPDQRIGLMANNNDVVRIKKRIVMMITELLDDNHFPPQIKEKLKQVKHQLELAQSTDELIKGFTQSIEVIVSSLKAERQTAEQFLFNLNSSILSLRECIKSGAQANTDAQDIQKTFNKSLTKQLKQISRAVTTSSSIEQCQESITTQMRCITEAFNTKVSQENAKHKELSKELKKLQSEISAIERESQALKKQLSEHKKNSLIDSLTKLPNRFSLDIRFEEEFQHWQEQKTPLAIAVVDLDHFKRINDNYGHAAGDKTLEIMAKLMQKIINKSNFIARFGGEEFVILMPNANLNNATKLMEVLRNKIASLPLKFKQDNISISISAGLTMLVEGDTKETAFNRADEALYQAKSQGRNKVIVN